VREFIILMAMLISIIAISIDALLPALGFIGPDLAVTNPNHTQYVIGFIFLGMTFGQLVCGPLSDAIGRKKVLYAGLALYMAGSVLCFFAASLPIMLLGRIIQGAGLAGPYISVVAIVRDKYEGREMAKIMSFVMSIFILVPAVAPLLGQGIMMLFSWRSIFLFYILYSIALLVWVYFRLDETLPPQKRIKFTIANFMIGFKEIASNRITVCYTICMGFCFGGLIGYLNSAQQVFHFGALALVIGAATLVNSQIVERLGMRLICRRSMFAIIIASAIYLALLYITGAVLWMFIAYVAVMFFAFGLMFGNLEAVAMEPMGQIAGIASSLIGALSTLVSMVLGAIIGQLYNGSLVPLTIGFLALGILSVLFMLIAEGKKANG